MDKEELLRRAQYDHRKGDERERQLEMKVLHETNAMIALFFFVLWLLSGFGAITGTITLFNVTFPAAWLLSVSSGIVMIFYHLRMYAAFRKKWHLLAALVFVLGIMSMLMIQQK